MDIAHKRHEHGSGTSHSMQRIYTRQKVNGTWSYVPVGWVCPDCGQIQRDK